MSVINFRCSEKEAEVVKTKVWAIIKEHYGTSAFPNTNVQYKPESKEVYSARLEELMKSQLCSVADSENGISVTFDTTEDAGFAIAEHVYGTHMGYSDEGLTYIKPVIQKIAKALPDICFDGQAICEDNWVCLEINFSYDGETLSSDDEEEDWSEFDEE